MKFSVSPSKLGAKRARRVRMSIKIKKPRRSL